MTEATGFNEKPINEMIERITAMRDTRSVQMRGGKKYTMVQDRVETLRRITGDFYRIETHMLQWGAEDGASIVFRAVIRDGAGQTVATGHAEEVRGSSQITDTSAVEVAETSAVGRALAMLGLHGGEFASAEELAVAANKLDKKKPAPAKPGALVHPAPPGPGAVSVTKEPEQLTLAVSGSSVMDAKIMQGVDPKIAEHVANINGNTPVIKVSEDDHMIAECFFTFMPLCNSVQETYSFWFANESLLNVVKGRSPELYMSIRNRFTDRRNELKPKDGAAAQ